MTTNQKHAARLRDVAKYADPEFKTSLLAGAEALEAQGEWRMTNFGGQIYMIPAERKYEWMAFRKEAEAGEYTAIVPSWAEPVPDDVVITGWRR